MTWTVTYVQDTEEPGVGTATASTVTASNQAVQVSRRLNTNDGADIDKFLAECTEAQQIADKYAADSAAVIAKVEAVLNSGK